jgi:hypothetical protein
MQATVIHSSLAFLFILTEGHFFREQWQFMNSCLFVFVLFILTLAGRWVTTCAALYDVTNRDYINIRFFIITLFYSAHIHTIESSRCLADVLACSQKVSHPEMRLVSAASWCIIPFSLLRTLVHAVSVCFHNLVTYRDCRIFIVRAWCSECVHTLDLGVSSHPKDVRVTSPKYFQRLIWTRKSLSLTGLEPRTSHIGVGRANHCATGSLNVQLIRSHTGLVNQPFIYLSVTSLKTLQLHLLIIQWRHVFIDVKDR